MLPQTVQVQVKTLRNGLEGLLLRTAWNSAAGKSQQHNLSLNMLSWCISYQKKDFDQVVKTAGRCCYAHNEKQKVKHQLIFCVSSQFQTSREVSHFRFICLWFLASRRLRNSKATCLQLFSLLCSNSGQKWDKRTGRAYHCVCWHGYRAPYIWLSRAGI